ncbi:Smr/MutS family protein [candidate division KSB1 bacterium]|nr:Smr/MutS family protein [candidate division KSB1 bacterium]
MKNKNDDPFEPVRVEDVLDLHGFFSEQIPEVLDEYLRFAVEQGYREVRIVHGKGKSRLKWEVQQFLKVDQRVRRFGDAPPERGGWGATLVEMAVE